MESHPNINEEPVGKNVLILHPESWYIEECCVKPENYTTAPTAALIMAAYLRSQGHQTEVSLYTVGCSQIKYDREPDAIIVYAPWQRFCQTTAPLFNGFKAQRPNLITIMVMYESLGNLEFEAMELCKSIDYTVIPNEKELAAGNILEYGQTRRPEGFGDRPGIIHRDEKDLPVAVKKRPAAKDLSHLPYFGDDLKDFLNRHPNHRYTDISILLERGCPKTCNFCPSRATRMRYRDPEVVADEAQLAASIFGGHNVSTMTHEVLHKTEPLIRFADTLIDRGIHIDWTIGARSDQVKDEALMSKLKQAGVKTLYFGLEAVTEEGRTRLMKPISDDDIARSIKIAQKVGLGFHVSLIMGFPWEDRAYIEQMKRFISDMAATPNCASIGLSRLIPYPGSPVEREMIEAGLLPDGLTLQDWNFREQELALQLQRTMHLSREELQAGYDELAELLGKTNTIGVPIQDLSLTR